MDRVLLVAIPLSSFLLMGLVGLSLSREEVLSAFQNVRTLAGGVILPWLVLPLLSLLMAATLSMTPDLRVSFLLLSACPVGGMASLYSLLSRANSGLTIVWTSISCLSAWALTPAVLWVYTRMAPDIAVVAVPFKIVAIQVGLMLALPVLLGMGLRRWIRADKERIETWIRRLAAVGLLILLGLAVASSPREFVEGLKREAGTVVVFTALALLAGEGLGRLLFREARNRIAFTFQLPVRNIAVAIVLAASILKRVDYAAFAAAFFVLQTLLLLGVVAVRRFAVRGFRRA
jgi:BASS family bile acid:Na+ symporter